MSDVPVAPQGAAPPSAAPAPAPAHAQNDTASAGREVPINQNPVSTPNPVGSQAPDKPDAVRRRESIQAAFDRASNPPPKGERPQPRPAAKASEARPGHNNPPEPTEKFDLKKPPGEQLRGDRGQFVPRAREDGQVRARPGMPNDTQQQPPQSPPQSPPQLPSHAPFAQPPQRLSEYARRDWAAAPESVRGEVWRQQQEFAKAYQFYKNDYEAYKPIKHFAKMAQDAGTDLKTALTNYIGIEQKIREDPIAGIDQIINNLNLIDPQSGRRLGVRDFAYTVLSQTPEQLKTTQMGNAQAATQHQMGAILQKLEKIENDQKQMQYNQQYSYTRSAVDQFAETHPRVDEKGFDEAIKQELNFGFDLETAYRRANALYPATHAAQTRTTSAQTRPIDRSIHGNPDVASSNGASRRPQKPSGSIREAVENATRRYHA
jgi:hypothetical protein